MTMTDRTGFITMDTDVLIFSCNPWPIARKDEPLLIGVEVLLGIKNYDDDR